MQLIGVDWRTPGESLTLQPRQATLLKADASSEMSLLQAINHMATSPIPCRVVTCDIPFGWNQHEASKKANASKVLQCDKDWDTPDNAWDPTLFMQVLAANKSTGLLHERHCLILWTPLAKVGEFTQALQDKGYSPPQVITWVKLDSSR